jgi:tetratricopeptide (TPR) repeat protein
LHQLLSKHYLLKGEYNNALDAINKAIELDQSHPVFFNIRANCYCGMAVTLTGAKMNTIVDKAIASYQECWDANQNTKNNYDEEMNSSVLFSIANMYFLKNDIDNVKLFWDKGMENFIAWLDELTLMPKTDKDFLASYLKKSLYLCGSCEKSKPKFKCGCGEAAYCDLTCQKANWADHKKICKAMKQTNKK